MKAIAAAVVALFVLWVVDVNFNGSRYTELSAEGFVCRVERLRDQLGVVAQMGLCEGLADAYTWYVREGWL